LIAVRISGVWRHRKADKGQIFWKAGDDYMGDPPMEEQGLNTVFDGDSTWKVIGNVGKTVAGK
jgi:mannan endo-1,4-beta-mannosidase